MKYKQPPIWTPTLSKEEIVAIDKLIDSAIPVSELAAHSKELMTIHLLRYYQETVFSAMLSQPGPFVGQDKYREAQNTILLWINNYCSDGSTIDSSTDEKLIQKIRELFELALTYACLGDFMNSLWQDLQEVKEVSKNEYEMAFFDDENMELGFTDFLSTNTYLDIERTPEYKACIFASAKHLRFKISGNEFQSLHPERILGDMRKHWLPVVSQWELNPEWSFGSYSLSEFRRFWEELMIYAFLYNAAWRHASNLKANYLYDFSVPIRNEHEWVTLLSARSKLSRKTTTAIIRDLTLDLQLIAQQNKKKTDSMYQPFVPVFKNKLALNVQAVIASNAERNFLALQSCINPVQFSKLISTKEAYWKAELIPKIEALGYKCFSKSLGGTGDIDLLIAQPETKSALTVELKFRNSIHRVKVIHIDEVLKGTNQATRAQKWLQSRTTRFSEEVTIDGTWDVRGLVVTKHQALLAQLGPVDSPAVCEQVFLYMLENLKLNLSKVWIAAKEIKYRARKNQHFKVQVSHWNFGPIKVKSHGLVPLKPWSLEEAFSNK